MVFLRHVRVQVQTTCQLKTTSYPEAQYQRCMVCLRQVQVQMQDPWKLKRTSCLHAQHQRCMLLLRQNTLQMPRRYFKYAHAQRARLFLVFDYI